MTITFLNDASFEQQPLLFKYENLTILSAEDSVHQEHPDVLVYLRDIVGDNVPLDHKGFHFMRVILNALLQGPDTFGILYPEHGLHSRVQAAFTNKLVELVVLLEKNVVIESHSDHVFNNLRIAVKRKDLDLEHLQVYCFKDDAFQPVRIYPDGGYRAPTGFFDQWEHDLFQLL